MDQIAEIKSKIDIVDLISNYLTLKKAGRNFKTQCPFHNEKTPSFIVSPELQIFKCFGCSESGDVIKFLQLYEKMEFWEAVEFLANKVGIKLVRRQLTNDERLKKKLYEINRLVADFYHFVLTKHDLGKKALDYVMRRGINKESIEKFNLGFSPLKQTAVVDFLLKKGYSKTEIIQTGLVFPTKSNTLWDRFNQRLTFPLYDHKGNVVGFSGRILDKNINVAKYINTPETKIYHKGEMLYGLFQARESVRKEKKIIVVEGEFDVISSHQEGIENVVAVKGTAFTEDQARLINRFAETAVLAMDPDIAGSEAIKRSSQIAEAIGLDVRVAVIPKGFSDLDDLIHKDFKKAKKTIETPEPVWDFIIDLAFSRYSVDDPAGQRKILKETLPFLGNLDNEVVKSRYLQKLAKGLRVDFESVLMELEKLKLKTDLSVSSPASKTEPVSIKQQLLEKYLLTLIFTQEEWKWLRDSSWHGLITNLLYQKIVALGKKALKGKRKIEVKDFFQLLPEELKLGFQEIYLASEKKEASQLKDDIKTIITSLEREKLRREMNQLGLQIAKMEKKGESKELTKLEKRFVEISQHLVQMQKD